MSTSMSFVDSETPTTTMKPLTTIVTSMLDGIKNAVVTSTRTTTTTSMPSPSMTTETATIITSPTTTSTSYHREHLAHQKISFEIPTHHDLKHIDNLHNFNTLLKRIGNVMPPSYDASQLANNFHNLHTINNTASTSPASAMSSISSTMSINNHQLITNAEISKSVVLDLADLKANNDYDFNFERFFAGADMHSIINYLWIGVVTSLIILSVIFIIFSCYFYRKFREWKKCNKNIRAHNNHSNNNNNNNNDEFLYPHEANERLTYCGNNNTENILNSHIIDEAYYQMESPPCYTIATGLPSYDEALLHHHKHQQEYYYNYAVKYTYPKQAMKQQQQQQQQQEQQQLQFQTPEQQQHQHHQQNLTTNFDEHFIEHWKKSVSTALTTSSYNNSNNNNSSNNNNNNKNIHIDSHKMLQYYNAISTKCCNNVQQYQQQQHQHQQQQQNIKVSTILLKPSLSSIPTAYDVAANVALLNNCTDIADMAIVMSSTSSTDTSSTPSTSTTTTTESITIDDDKIEICIDDDDDDDDDSDGDDDDDDDENDIVTAMQSSMNFLNSPTPIQFDENNFNKLFIV